MEILRRLPLPQEKREMGRKMGLSLLRTRLGFLSSFERKENRSPGRIPAISVITFWRVAYTCGELLLYTGSLIPATPARKCSSHVSGVTVICAFYRVHLNDSQAIILYGKSGYFGE